MPELALGTRYVSGREKAGVGPGGREGRWVPVINTTVDGEDIAIGTCRSVVLVQQRLRVQRVIAHMVKSFHSDNFLEEQLGFPLLSPSVGLVRMLRSNFTCVFSSSRSSRPRASGRAAFMFACFVSRDRKQRLLYEVNENHELDTAASTTIG